MSNTSSPLSPRLRSREPIGPPMPAARRAAADPAALRVLLRLPNLMAESPPSRIPRFRIADRLFSTLRRKYAALSLVVFIVCVAAMLLRGKRTSPPVDEGAGDAPRWNAAIAPAVELSKKPAPQFTAAPTRDEGPLPWRPAPNLSADAANRPAFDSSGGNRAVAGPATPSAENPLATGSRPSNVDNVPTMAPRFPGREMVADRTAPTRTMPPTAPPTEYRTAQRPSGPVSGPLGGSQWNGPPAGSQWNSAPPPAANSSGYGQSIYSTGADSSGQAHLMNRIDPTVQPRYDSAGSQNFR